MRWRDRASTGFTRLLPMLTVVSHDAGGAEILSSWVRRHAVEAAYVLGGPARAIFERKLGPVRALPLEAAIQQTRWVLCGTSWQSDMELEALELARASAKHSVAFLDHWVNYHERFVRAGVSRLPDEIWVGDPIAQVLAAKEFEDIPVRLVANPYFADIKEELSKLSPQHGRLDRESLRVLYVCEPVGEHGLRQFGNARHLGYVEQEALDYFLSNVHALGTPVDRVLLRPHPSEPDGKYDALLGRYDLSVSVTRGRTLLEDVIESDVVVGCESMAMIVGVLAGRRVVSCIPPGGRPCTLPQNEIEHLQHLLGATR
jgi:hypothetical protein